MEKDKEKEMEKDKEKEKEKKEKQKEKEKGEEWRVVQEKGPAQVGKGRKEDSSHVNTQKKEVEKRESGRRIMVNGRRWKR